MIQYLAIGITALTLAQPEPVITEQRAISYSSFQSGRAYFHQVTVDLNNATVSPEVVLADRPTSIYGFTQNDMPAVAITGTFFNTWSAYPVGDVVVDGKQVASGQRGSMIGVDWNGSVEIVDTAFKQPVDLSKYRFALRGAVRLIKGGVVAPNPKAQKFRDPRIWGRASRCAIGINHKGELAMFATKYNVTLWELGSALHKRGIVEAISMDGGGSTSFMYRGEALIHPGRGISNMFMVYERSPFVAPTEKSFLKLNW